MEFTQDRINGAPALLVQPASVQLIPEIYRLEAQGSVIGDLLGDVESDIGAFICHLAREVEEGAIAYAVLSFFNDHFSEITR
jgi:hypothetical protein